MFSHCLIDVVEIRKDAADRTSKKHVLAFALPHWWLSYDIGGGEKSSYTTRQINYRSQAYTCIDMCVLACEISLCSDCFGQMASQM